MQHLNTNSLPSREIRPSRFQPPDTSQGSSSVQCPDWWSLQLMPGTNGIATSGNFSLDISVVKSDLSTATASLTVAYNISLADFITLLKGNSDLTDANGELVFNVKYGPLHQQSFSIGNKTVAGHRITNMVWSTNTLDSGQPYILTWRPS